jgi:hypothetical protein
MIHNMSSCQGELPNTEFFVQAIDQKGRILFNNSITTLRNGFFELWLPRDRMVQLSINGLNRSVNGMIATFDDSKTCETTFQLK